MGEAREITHTGATTSDAGNGTASEAESSDGRTQRRERNREAVLQALIDLVAEGDLNPTVSKITERAGVSDRSLFRYFDDFADLSRTAFDREFARLLPVATIADVGEGDLDHRVEQMVSTRVRINDLTHAIFRLARSQALRIPALDQRLNELVGLSRQQVKRQFEPELAAMSAEAAADVVNALVTSLSPEAYDVLARQLGAQRDEIAGALRRTVHSLLTS